MELQPNDQSDLHRMVDNLTLQIFLKCYSIAELRGTPATEVSLEASEVFKADLNGSSLMKQQRIWHSAVLKSLFETGFIVLIPFAQRLQAVSWKKRFDSRGEIQSRSDRHDDMAQISLKAD
jgi:hypothetical protein